MVTFLKKMGKAITTLLFNPTGGSRWIVHFKLFHRFLIEKRLNRGRRDSTAGARKR